MRVRAGKGEACRWIAAIALACALGNACARSEAQASGASVGAVPARQLVEQAVDDELKFLRYEAPYMRYRMRMIDGKGDREREVIQSRDGAVSRLVLRDGHPLSAEEDAAERERLEQMLSDPDAYRKHADSDISSKKMARELIRMLPGAMTYSYAEGQPQRPDAHGPEIVIDYKPDPAWKPPTMVSAALTGVQGRIWLDAKTHAMTAMEGEIFHPVNFGLGVLARIHEGGKLWIEQGEVARDKWFFTHFTEHLSVRALLVKNVREDGDATAWGFSEVKPMSYQDAVRMLLAMPDPAHAREQ